MAKAKRAAAAGKTRGAADTKSDYAPFLKAADIEDGEIVTLTGWTRDKQGQFGPQILCEVTLNRTAKTYDLAVKVGSPSHRTLFKTMGPDFHKWRGQITLGLKGGTNGDYIVVRGTNSEEAPF